ncbi:MAG: FeoC-like transcriptional regulator, partial [Kiritimatiellia bacterium]
LAIHFGMQEEAMEGILVALERRGTVRRHAQPGCASGCGGCKGCSGMASPPSVIWSVSADEEVA